MIAGRFRTKMADDKQFLPPPRVFTLEDAIARVELDAQAKALAERQTPPRVAYEDHELKNRAVAPVSACVGKAAALVAVKTSTPPVEQPPLRRLFIANAP